MCRSDTAQRLLKSQLYESVSGIYQVIPGIHEFRCIPRGRGSGDLLRVQVFGRGLIALNGHRTEGAKISSRGSFGRVLINASIYG